MISHAISLPCIIGGRGKRGETREMMANRPNTTSAPSCPRPATTFLPSPSPSHSLPFRTAHDGCASCESRSRGPWRTCRPTSGEEVSADACASSERSWKIRWLPSQPSTPSMPRLCSRGALALAPNVQRCPPYVLGRCLMLSCPLGAQGWPTTTMVSSSSMEYLSMVLSAHCGLHHRP